jgi:hypothetical protein
VVQTFPCRQIFFLGLHSIFLGLRALPLDEMISLEITLKRKEIWCVLERREFIEILPNIDSPVRYFVEGTYSNANECIEDWWSNDSFLRLQHSYVGVPKVVGV